MKRKQLRFANKGFQVAIGNKRSQAAEMMLLPGESEGGPGIAIAAATSRWLKGSEPS